MSTKNSIKQFLSALSAICIGIVCGATLSIIPLTVIYHRHLRLFFSNLPWPIIEFFIICLLSGAIIYSLYKHQKLSLKPIDWLGILYLSLYTASAALCQKIGLGTINTYWLSAVLINIGLLFIALTAGIQISTLILNYYSKSTIEQGKLSHPIYFSWPIFMLGISLLFLVWLPLIALPGSLIAIKWLAFPDRISNNN